MKVSSRSILPVIEYIMNMFSEPFNSPSDKNYSTISLLLSQFISQQISYDECHKAIDKITQDCKPLEKLKSILDVPPQPLPSDSETDLNFNFSSYMDSSTQSKHQPASLPVLSTTKKKFQNWSTAEDDRLICGIIRFGFDNWTTIANFVGNNRTRSQCNQRWSRGLDPHISRDQWTSEESQKLISLVQIHGEKSWTHIASVMGNRSDIQCRYHFYQMTKRSRGYSFSNDTNSPIPKFSNGPARLSTPSINMPNYILPANFPTSYPNTKSTTDSLSNTRQTDSKSLFEPTDSLSRQRPLPPMLAPRMSAPILQNMPQIRSSSVAGINPNMNLTNVNMSNGNTNMINSNNNMNTLSNMNNNNNQMPNLNMISNMNSLSTINNNINNLNNLQTNNNMNNSTLNNNMNYQSFFPQVQQGPPMPQLNGFPRMNQFNPPPPPAPPPQQPQPQQDPFFDSGPSTNVENTSNNNTNNNSISSTLNSNKNPNNSVNNVEDNHFEEEDIDTVFQFSSKYSGIDDFIDDNGSWVVDRYKGYDVSREKYENEFIF